MPRLILTILVVAVCIYALIDCLRSDSREVRGVPKWAWIVALIVLPVLGTVLWFFLGRPRNTSTPAPQRQAPDAAQNGRPIGPDDDPQFLRNLQERRRNEQEAQRLADMRRQLEDKERRLRNGEDDAPGQDG
ncbi:PLDc N-terminal domain-containing protein [Arthrobacter sp. NPDC090010]|uniref:PLDc N-terminal domain-containing protein n=1 Tax=Arthrobacter sp. NPDC090010 TaxID=3363942 RepID=UPI003805BB38